MKLFGIIANPVLHSLSPALQNAAFQASQIDARYLRILSPTSADAKTAFQGIPLLGANISAPYKESLNDFVDDLSSEAKALGAINTIVAKNNSRIGYNTDVSGVLHTLHAEVKNIADKKIAILGSGGAAKAACLAVQTLGGTPIVIARNESSLRYFHTLSITSLPLSESNISSDISGIISTIPVNASNPFAQKLSKGSFFFDAQYKDMHTIPNSITGNDIKYISGKHWLAHQAGEAFSYFTGHTVVNEIFFKALETARTYSHKKIFLVGAMGSGKSTVALELATALSKSSIDLDTEIENKTGSTITDIFQSKGEAYFRTLEETALKESIQSRHEIVSCGGGIVTSPAARRLMKEAGLVIWLTTSPTELYKRLSNEPQDKRPLLAEEKLRESIDSLLNTRTPLYAEVADLVVFTDHKIPRELALDITNELSR